MQVYDQKGESTSIKKQERGDHRSRRDQESRPWRPLSEPEAHTRMGPKGTVPAPISRRQTKHRDLEGEGISRLSQ